MSDPDHSTGPRVIAVQPREEEEEFVLFACHGRLPEQAIRNFARTLREQVAGGRAFHCLIADDRTLRRLNRKFRGKDYPTDVLSFPSEQRDFLGEIAISSHRAMSQALEFGHPALIEIQILMLHGVLHLLGMDHENDSGDMARAEALWRKKLGLPTGLIERARS